MAPGPEQKPLPHDSAQHRQPQYAILFVDRPNHLSYVHRRALADGAKQGLIHHHSPDCIPMDAQIVSELCDVDLWQAASCQDYVVANIPLCTTKPAT